MILSIAELTSPSSSISRRNTETMHGTAQKSPHTHKMPAPICWSANGGSVTPGTWSYTGYHGGC